MDRQRLYNCVRVLVALQCLELVWSYSILIDTLKNDQQIENSLNALIQEQNIQQRFRRQAPDPQPDNPDLLSGKDPGVDGTVSDSGSQGDGGVQETGSNIDSGDPQGSDPHSDSSALTGDQKDPNSFKGDASKSDQPKNENVDPGHDSGNNPDPSHEGSNSNSPHSDSGHSDSGHSDPSGEQSVSDQHNPLDMTRPGELPPMALPMTASDTGEAPVAMAMTGGQGQHMNQPYSFYDAGHSDVASSDHGNLESGGDGGHVDTVPMEGHEGQPHHLPMALPQRQEDPSGNRGRQNFQPPMWNRGPVAMPQRQGQPGGQKNQRPPPNWNKGNQGRPAPSGGGGGGGGGAPPNNMGPPMNMGGVMPQMPTGGNRMEQMHQMNMMRAQSEVMKDHMETQSDMYRNMYNPYARFNPQYFPGASGNNNNQNFPNPYGNYPFPPYKFGDHGDFEGFPGYGIDIRAGFPPCTNMSDPACKQQMMAHREIQIETPYGEMDMEPGEMDLEGVAAHQLLKQIGLGGPNMNPIMQEINLNQNVLRALKQRFKVNTTAGIQRMSNNPEFQAFMYRVLTHSKPVAPGEYNANLTQAEVNWILNDLSASSGSHRLSTGKLDDAKLNTQNTTSSSGKKTSNTVLTINGPNTNPWANMGMMGPFPAFAGQTQDASAAQAVNQPGIVQALVQGMLGGEGAEGAGGGEAGEAAEEKKKTNVTQGGEVGEASPSQAPEGQNTGTVGSGTVNSASTAGLISNPGPSAVSPTANNQETLGQSPATQGKEADIIGKDGKFGLSKDQRRRNEKLLAEQNAAAGAGTNMQGPQESIPIGIQEAGLDTLAVTNTTLEPPVEALPSGYASSTAFAIAAITMIILAIIVGPILCYLCKLKEKRDEKLRKQKAMKNREVSENNIMESMVLHDFGRDAQATVSNDGASPYGERYTTLDSDLDEIERYKRAGFLP